MTIVNKTPRSLWQKFPLPFIPRILVTFSFLIIHCCEEIKKKKILRDLVQFSKLMLNTFYVLKAELSEELQK